MTGEILKLIAVNAAVIFFLAILLWRVAVRINDPSFIDVCWGAGFVVVAWTTFLQTHAHAGRRPLLVALTTLWGLRLAGYLFWRWRKNGPDSRYVFMLKRVDNPSMFMLTRVFMLQAALLSFVVLPVELGQVYDSATNLRAIHAVGVVLAVIGIVFESTGDFQLVKFKADPANEGQVMDRGLWHFTRHPNYFGDFCVWWGLFFVSLTNAVTLIGIVGPIVMSVLLMRVSGVGPLEKQLNKTKPKYKDYVARTSGFFPLPPKQRATSSS